MFPCLVDPRLDTCFMLKPFLPAIVILRRYCRWGIRPANIIDFRKRPSGGLSVLRRSIQEELFDFDYFDQIRTKPFK